MSSLRDVYNAKKEFINDDAELTVIKLNTGYLLSLFHNRDKFEYCFDVQNRDEFFSLIIELFNCFDFSYFMGGDIEDLKISLGKYGSNTFTLK